ncbi:hypothetical protein LJC57_06750 [Parabacteroides sp. OttesenSCG-928-G07]|nr:hypothetical protein [Parabacteroides sp. OttesenSCG-928-G07]
MQFIKYIVGFCLLMLFYGCSSKQTGDMIALSDLDPISIPEDSEYVVEIKDWLAIGPFEVNSFLADPAKSFYREDLKRYGIKEGLINEKGISKLQKRGIRTFLIEGPSPQVKLFSYVPDQAEKKSNFYLISRIHSDKAQEATLIIDGSNSYAMWLNGDKLVEVTGKYNTNKITDRFVNISLKEGENILFVKVNRGTNRLSWDLICAIASRREGERIFSVNYARDFVVNPIVSNTLEVYAGPYTSGKVEVKDEKGQVVVNSSFGQRNTNDAPFVVSGLSEIEDGFYNAALTVGDKRLEEVIYKGDYNEFVHKMKARVAEINKGNSYAEDLKIALQKVEFMHNKPGDPNSPNETRYLNKNRVFWGYSLYRMLNENPLTQLMTYSDEEGRSGTFIFHKDNKLQKNIPLVIVMPFALEGDLMIEDWYTSNLDQIETDNALADQYGFAVAWIYAGGKNYSAEKAGKEITAIISRLQSEYDMDDRRLFIMGDCEGGRRALVQIATSPNRYAACGLMFPITLSGGIDGVPIDLLPQMDKIPMIIKHGTNDVKSPVENSRRFYTEAQKLDIPVEYIETQGSHVYLERDYRGFIFEFFSRIIAE